MKQNNIRTLLAAALTVIGLAAHGDFTYEWHTTDSITRPNAPSVITADDVLSGVTAYLIDADKLNQQTLLTSFFEDAGLTPFEQLVNVNGSRLSSAKITTEGSVENTPFSPPSAGTAGHAYFALTIQQDEESLLYISGYSTISSSSYAGDGTLVLNAASSHGDINRTTTFLDDPPTAGDGGGWYAAVPEPTSGLLMLLGLAALALRRRRA